MKKLGISVYPEIVGVEPTHRYIDLAHENGFRIIFMNLLEVWIPSENRCVKEVTTYDTGKGIEVIFDVNP